MRHSILSKLSDEKIPTDERIHLARTAGGNRHHNPLGSVPAI